MDRKLPVISIIDSIGKHGGLHYYVDGVARGLASRGHSVRVHVTVLTGTAPARPYETRVVFGDLYGSDPTAKRALRYFAGLTRALWLSWRAGADIVHLHAFHYDLRELAAIWGSRLAGMKVILTVHDIESFGHARSSRIKRLALAGASALMFHNRFSKAEFERLGGTTSVPSAIIPHGHYVDAYPEPMPRTRARRLLGLPSEDMVFLFFGNPREEKGLDLLLRALVDLKDRPGWRLVTAGKMKPPQQAYFRDLVDRLGLSDRVRLDAKHVSDEEALAYYGAADLVVVPYRRVYESGVTIMSMSLGRAVLVSDLEPLVDLVAGGRFGLIFHSEDAASLADALVESMNRKAELDDVGAAARDHVVETRNWNGIGALLGELAGEILSRPRD